MPVIRTLASHEIRGRGFGMPELDQVANFLAAQFRGPGLQAAGDQKGIMSRAYQCHSLPMSRAVATRSVEKGCSKMTTTNGREVVIIGGGIVGTAIAYFLGKAGVKSVVVERDSVGSHASGFAYGGLSPLGGSGIPGPIADIAQEGMRLHRAFAHSLPDETGINLEYRQRPSLTLAFTHQEVQQAQASLAWQQQQPGYTARWSDATEAKTIEPRISEKTIGAVFIEGTAEVEPYRLVLALARVAENLGARIRHGRVTGLKRQGERVTGVILEHGEMACDTVVLAMGPWSGETSAWLHVPIKVRPLKGQILRLRAPGPPFTCSIGWGGNYATTKPDGLLWAGTTEEEAGFHEHPTTEGRDTIITSLLKMIPSLTDAQLAQHTACLRPLPLDELLLLGPVPGWQGVYMATGAGRKGILLGPAMGRITADLITQGNSHIRIDAFDPGRFARQSELA
ncbi:Glycine oxidase [Candidatus Entotheonellaceae bacterium PAL068K]